MTGDKNAPAMTFLARVVPPVKAGLRHLGARLERDRAMRDPVRLTLLKARELGTRSILDVGAGAGQFAQAAFKAGWQGNVISFEPLAVNHAQLARAAKGRSNWIVPPAIALGARPATAEINVSLNLLSSSLLSVGAASTDVLEETRQVRSEPVTVRAIDEAIETDWAAPFAIKIDTQGFELEVLRGAVETLKSTVVLMVEMSLAPLYDGGARFGELYQHCEDAGFRCIALTEGFADYRRNEVLQVDAVFVRDR